MTPLTERSASELARAIRAAEVSAADVVEVHIERHIRCAPRVDALVAERFDAARSEATAADRRVAAAEPNDQLPPLLGVPFTVKESIALAGMPQSAGLVARREYRIRQRPAVERLIDAAPSRWGTGTSEFTLWMESKSRLPPKLHPLPPHSSRGRLHGGEGGGRLRRVAVRGRSRHRRLDPNSGVLLRRVRAQALVRRRLESGLLPPTPGPAASMLQTGPLTRRGQDLMPLLRIMAGRDPEDPMSRDVTLGDPVGVGLSGLRVTAVENASWVPMSRELRDARELAVGALRAAGADVRHISLRSWRHALFPYLATLQARARIPRSSCSRPPAPRRRRGERWCVAAAPMCYRRD